MKINQRIRELRSEKNLSQEELSKILNVSRAAISHYESGKRVPDMEIQKKLSSYFNVSLDYLNGEEASKSHKESYLVPVFYAVSCGSPFLADDDIIDYEEIDPALKSQGDYFGLKLRGASMEPRFQDGDVVIVKKQAYIESGEIAIVRVNGDEATMKIVEKSEQGLTLIATNPSVFTPKFYTKEQVQELPVTIVGKVIELRAKF